MFFVILASGRFHELFAVVNIPVSISLLPFLPQKELPLLQQTRTFGRAPLTRKTFLHLLWDNIGSFNMSHSTPLVKTVAEP